MGETATRLTHTYVFLLNHLYNYFHFFSLINWTIMEIKFSVFFRGYFLFSCFFTVDGWFSQIYLKISVKKEILSKVGQWNLRSRIEFSVSLPCHSNWPFRYLQVRFDSTIPSHCCPNNRCFMIACRVILLTLMIILSSFACFCELFY